MFVTATVAYTMAINRRLRLTRLLESIFEREHRSTKWQIVRDNTIGRAGLPLGFDKGCGRQNYDAKIESASHIRSCEKYSDVHTSMREHIQPVMVTVAGGQASAIGWGDDGHLRAIRYLFTKAVLYNSWISKYVDFRECTAVQQGSYRADC